jgi:hypothetical protein
LKKYDNLGYDTFTPYVLSSLENQHLSLQDWDTIMTFVVYTGREGLFMLQFILNSDLEENDKVALFNKYIVQEKVMYDLVTEQYESKLDEYANERFQTLLTTFAPYFAKWDKNKFAKYDAEIKHAVQNYDPDARPFLSYYGEVSDNDE